MIVRVLRFTQPKNAGNANLWGLEFSYQRDFGFIAPALKYVGFLLVVQLLMLKN